MKPEVTVILPHFEGHKWLPRAIECVQAQQGILWELVIVDDGSKQSPASFITSLNDDRIYLIRQKNAGKGAALNTGIKESRAKIICFLDQDDVMLPGRLELQLDAFAQKPESDVVYSDYERVSEDGKLIDQFISYQSSAQECIKKLVREISPLSMQTIMIKRETLVSIDGFCEDSKLTGLDDAEFFFRLFLSGPTITYQRGIVQQWTAHDDNYSKSARFNETRLILLNYLSNLSTSHALLRQQLPYIRFRTYYMRGLYYLENKLADKAASELLKALRSYPFKWNCYYLLIKSLVHQFVYR